MNTPKPIEAKIAKFVHNTLPDVVIKAATHPILCKLNLHNSSLLKKINSKARVVYYMSYHQDELVKAPYSCEGGDNVESALFAILELINSDTHENHKEFIFKRISYLANEALVSLREKNHQDWVQRIHVAIHAAKTKKPVKKTTPVKPEKLVKPTKKKKPVKRLRNKKGQFIKVKSRR